MLLFFANLLSQVVEKQATPSLEVVKFYEEYRSKDFLLIQKEIIIDLLRKVLSSHDTSYIIIDALDECTASDHSEIVEKLEFIGVHLLISSRYPVPFTSSHRFQLYAQAEDIRTFVKTRYKGRILKFIEKDPALETDIVNKLCEKSDGM